MRGAGSAASSVPRGGARQRRPTSQALMYCAGRHPRFGVIEFALGRRQLFRRAALQLPEAPWRPLYRSSGQQRRWQEWAEARASCRRAGRRAVAGRLSLSGHPPPLGQLDTASGRARLSHRGVRSEGPRAVVTNRDLPGDQICRRGCRARCRRTIWGVPASGLPRGGRSWLAHNLNAIMRLVHQDRSGWRGG